MRLISVISMNWVRDERWAWIWLMLVILLTTYVHIPLLYLGFTGDDFQWWQQSRMTLDDPSLLLIPGGAYRPINTWTLLLNYLLFGTDPIGYHATNLLFHLICGALFWFLLGRFSFSAPARAGIVILWLCSPYSLEPVQFVNIRYDIVLPICWLALALIWPKPENSWSRGRLSGAVALAGLTLFAVETWVVLPAFVFCFDLCLHRVSFLKALYRSALVGLAPLIYVFIYFRNPPMDPNIYYTGGLKAATKIPHAWAVFSNLSVLYPLEFPFGTMEVFSLVVMSLLARLGWQQRNSLIGIGFAFFLLPFLPILPVAFMGSRYTAIPLIGFLMIVGAGVKELMTSLKGWWYQIARIAVSTLILLVLWANLGWLHGDRIDAQRASEAHAKLLAEAQAFVPGLPHDRFIVAIRLETENPLLQIALNSQGVLKLYYPRHPDPYALINWAALFSYTLETRGGPIYIEVPFEEANTSNYIVIGHVQGGFVQLPAEAPTARDAAIAWNRHHHVRVLKPWRL